MVGGDPDARGEARQGPSCAVQHVQLRTLDVELEEIDPIDLLLIDEVVDRDRHHLLGTVPGCHHGRHASGLDELQQLAGSIP